MRYATLEELRKVQLGIMDVLVKFCEENGIRYFLSYGTLIGAVRHQGFIPWDDDVDICMLRKDYDKFVAAFDGYHADYVLYSTENSDWFPYPYAKLAYRGSILEENTDLMRKNIGINIDIFPLDKFPDDPKGQKRLLSQVGRLRQIVDVKAISVSSSRAFYKNAILKTGKALFRFVSPKSLITRIIRLSTQFEDTPCQNVGCVVWGNGTTEIVPISLFEELVELEFEGNRYLAPKGYHQWLTSIYGDYMKLPPENQQVTHHDFKAYLVER